MAKLSDELNRTLAEAGEGLKALQDEVIEAGFDPDDPASIQAAIRHVENTVDAKVARFQDNALVREADEQIKAECRANILAQVEVATTKSWGANAALIATFDLLQKEALRDAMASR